MAKGPQARYNPGELDATRRRLGNMSQEEAREMAKKLGMPGSPRKPLIEYLHEEDRGDNLDQLQSRLSGIDEKLPALVFRAG